MTLTEVRRLLEERGIRPSKVLGQNFLIDANILRIIIEQADIRPDETVVEVGPGLGALTDELTACAKCVVAVEKDPRLCVYLREHLKGVNLIEGDAVEVALPVTPPFKVVSNLPYSISTPILERFVETEPRPRRMVVTVQREVADRLAARPRCKEYGALTLFTQLRYHVTLAHIVSPGCFFPKPHVESAIVVLDRRDPRVTLEPGAPFHAIVRLGFGQRRKMLRKLLAPYDNVSAAFVSVGISPTVRGEELGLDQWIKLANELRPRP